MRISDLFGPPVVLLRRKILCSVKHLSNFQQVMSLMKLPTVTVAPRESQNSLVKNVFE